MLPLGLTMAFEVGVLLLPRADDEEEDFFTAALRGVGFFAGAICFCLSPLGMSEEMSLLLFYHVCTRARALVVQSCTGPERKSEWRHAKTRVVKW